MVKLHTTLAEGSELNVSIIGENGDLARALYNNLMIGHHVVCYGKDQYNFLNKEDIIALVDHVYQSDIIINCPGIFTSDDSWDMFTINAVAPTFLLEKLVEKKSRAHVIIIGSHSAMWSSWPSISLERLSYNVSKETIQSFVTGLEQSKKSNLKLTIFNPSRFKSKMSDHTGYPIESIVDAINYIIKSKVTPLVYELGTSND